MVGSALVRRFQKEPGFKLILRDRDQLDLTSQSAVTAFLAAEKPDAVVIAAAKVGGIHANSTYPAEFLHVNLAIASGTIHGAWSAGVERLLFLGSSCIYPKHAAQPMAEECLLTGALEPTNEAYAVAKIAGLKLCQAFRRQYGADFISGMPSNLYGPGDNYHPEHSHVPAALIRRMDEARRAHAPQVTVWGTGKPLREFLYVDDCADACVHLLKTYSGEVAHNIGSGQEVSIADFARHVAKAVGYRGELRFDTSRPDGTPRKLVDVAKLKALGWSARTSLDEGLALAHADYLARLKAGAIAA